MQVFYFQTHCIIIFAWYFSCSLQKKISACAQVKLSYFCRMTHIVTTALSRTVSEINGDFSVFFVPAEGVPLGIGYRRMRSKDYRMMGLPGRTRSLTISSALWIQYTDVRDRRGHFPIYIYRSKVKLQGSGAYCGGLLPHSLLNWAVYTAHADWQRIQCSILLWTWTRSRIFRHNPLTDANSKFRDPHISELNLSWTLLMSALSISTF